MGIVLEHARERFLDRRQQVRLQREREKLNDFLGLEPDLIVTVSGIETDNWKTLNPDEDDVA